uniref:Uncharacterized protein n=1 Tax=Branchiostoma floridae TaxID=7739 RepID=C3YFA2_BRAFL|eukprot:XP_002605094.1 hypothetical protein BRAFLDRAFT_85242 [Branchiostoma floridae]
MGAEKDSSLFHSIWEIKEAATLCLLLPRGQRLIAWIINTAPVSECTAGLFHFCAGVYHWAVPLLCRSVPLGCSTFVQECYYVKCVENENGSFHLSAGVSSLFLETVLYL